MRIFQGVLFPVVMEGIDRCGRKGINVGLNSKKDVNNSPKFLFSIILLILRAEESWSIKALAMLWPQPWINIARFHKNLVSKTAIRNNPPFSKLLVSRLEICFCPTVISNKRETNSGRKQLTYSIDLSSGLEYWLFSEKFKGRLSFMIDECWLSKSTWDFGISDVNSESLVLNCQLVTLFSCWWDGW